MLPQFVARNTMLVAAVQDPSLRVLAAGRAGAGGLHVAAAERSLVELDRVARALTRYGMHVVQGPVAGLASEVADRYWA